MIQRVNYTISHTNANVFKSLSLSTDSPDQEWFKTYVGEADDYGYSVKQTMDGGFIIAGNTHSYGAGLYRDILLIRTDSHGNELWSKTYGGEFEERGKFVQQTLDGGFVVVGFTCSFGAGQSDLAILKVDAYGNKEWLKTFGGLNAEEGNSIQKVDGGYIVTGYTRSHGVGNDDVYLIKTDRDGNEIWTKTYGGPDSDRARSVHQTIDGGYIIGGITGYKKFFEGDVFLIKVGPHGNEEWSTSFGGAQIDYCRAVIQSNDGGYVLVGYTRSYGAGSGDIYVIKTDGNGVETWSRTFGGIEDEEGFSVQKTVDGAYIIAGYTKSFGAGNGDIYLIKIDEEGHELWSQTFGAQDDERGYSVQETVDSGYIITGYTRSFSNDNKDVYLLKLKQHKGHS